MARSLYAKLFRLYGTPRPPAALREMSTAARGRLHLAKLLPGDIDTARLTGTLPRVAVVGAGFAGLAAAWYLRQCGIDVTVYEATGRIGGRVETDRSFIAHRTVEAGAELIGLNHPMWTELADHFGLRLAELGDEPDARIRFGDRELDDVAKKQLRIDMEPVLDAIGTDAQHVDPLRPWQSPNAYAFDAMSVSDRLDQIIGLQSSLVRTALEFILGNDNCAVPSQQSYLGLLCLVSAGRMGSDREGMRGFWQYTETHRCAGGNDQLATALAASLGDLRLNTPVVNLAVEDQGVSVDAGNVCEPYGYAILAAPPTCWPTVESSQPWNPATYTMAHGPAVKHLNRFSRKFWEDHHLSPSAIWDYLGSVWESTDQQTGPGEFGLSVYAGGQYARAESTYPRRLAELYPGYAPDRTRFVDWPRRPYILTGYSVPAPRQVSTVGRALSAPFGRRLYFAGEQTYLGFFGYMEGALRSGTRAAREIVAAINPGAVGPYSG